MMPARTRSGIALLSVVALFSYWLSRGGDSNEDAPIEGLNIRLDYALQDFEARQFDLQGHESFRIIAPGLSNDANSGVGTIDQPRIRMRQEDTVWNIIATSAIVTPDRDRILFKGDVNIRQQDPTVTHSLEINTQELLFNVIEKIASTDQPVTVLDGPNQINATGLRVEFQTRSFELLHQVWGFYAVD
jgi:LPS export ABC transporter protein LptC